jgi:hypothetical protein
MNGLLKNPIVVVGGLGVLLAVVLMSKGSGGSSGSNTLLASENISSNANIQAQKYSTAVAIAAMQQAHADLTTNTGFNVAVLQTIQAENQAAALVKYHYDTSRAGITALGMTEKTNLALANLDANTRLALAPIQGSTAISLAKIQSETTQQVMAIQAANAVTLAQINASVRSGGNGTSGSSDIQNAGAAAGAAMDIASFFGF